MNEIAIISDIHGNYPALKAVLADLDKRKITIVYCLGDLVGYYCFFNEVVECLRERNIPCIMGNHDYAMIYEQGVIQRSKTCTRILKWQLEGVSRENLDFLKKLPNLIEFDLSRQTVFCTHGGLDDYVDEYLFEVNNEYLAKTKFTKDILVTGHTHLPSYKKFYSGQCWVNPGSVGQPRDGDNRASYFIFKEDGRFEFARVPYNFREVVDEMAKLGFDEYISAPLITGKKIGL